MRGLNLSALRKSSLLWGSHCGPRRTMFLATTSPRERTWSNYSVTGSTLSLLLLQDRMSLVLGSEMVLF